MKKVLLFILMSTILTGFAQGSKKMPAINVFTVSGDTINSAHFQRMVLRLFSVFGLHGVNIV